MMKKNITPEYLMEYFKKNGKYISPKDAVKSLDQLYFLAGLIVKNNAFFNEEGSNQKAIGLLIKEK